MLFTLPVQSGAISRGKFIHQFYDESGFGLNNQNKIKFNLLRIRLYHKMKQIHDRRSLKLAYNNYVRTTKRAGSRMLVVLRLTLRFCVSRLGVVSSCVFVNSVIHLLSLNDSSGKTEGCNGDCSLSRYIGLLLLCLKWKRKVSNNNNKRQGGRKTGVD